MMNMLLKQRDIFQDLVVQIEDCLRCWGDLEEIGDADPADVDA